MGFEVRQQGRQVAGPLQHRPGGMTQIDTQLIGNDMGQGRLAQPRRAENQGMVQRFLALARGLDKDRHLLAHGLLTDIISQRTGANSPVHNGLITTLARRNHAFCLNHWGYSNKEPG